MRDSRQIYTSQDVAFIIPTKDRPDKLKNLLNSIAGQNEVCGRIIVVDGGKSVKDVVMGFYGRLPVEYYECYPPGQIRQRNIAISLLNDRTPLVGFFDDDMVLESNALEKMIEFWNGVEAKTAGVGFNVTNVPPHRYSALFAVLLMSSKKQGRVLLSGANVSILNVSGNIKSQWLGGGYTIWRREIVDKYSNDNLNTRWAIGEDVRYSYPIGKSAPLYVCADACVRHEHVYNHVQDDEFHRFQGYKAALAYLYFVESHPELSRIACLWMILGSTAAGLIYGLLHRSSCRRRLRYAQGQLQAVFRFGKIFSNNDKMRVALED